MDYLQHHLDSYFKVTGWSNSNNYSQLLDPVSKIISFPAPTGLSFQIGRSITDQLKSSFTVGVVPSTQSVGYLFSSLPCTPNRELPSICKAIPYSGTFRPNYLMYGRMFQNGKLEGIYAHRVSPQSLLIASGISAWVERPGLWSNMQFQFLHHRESNGLFCEASYSSDNQISGINILKRISKSWSIGTEAYYTNKETSGGLSVAIRYQNLFNAQYGAKEKNGDVFTFVANPIMGHYSLGVATDLSNDLHVATKYHHKY